LDFGFDRVEVDVWYRASRFILSHDAPLGRWAIGRNGAEFSSRFHVPVRRERSFLRLPQLLGLRPPPLVVDLKGRWPDCGFEQLSTLLAMFGRADDMVASRRWGRLARCAAVASEQRLAYGAGERGIRHVLAGNGPRPSAVSIEFRALTESLDLVGDMHRAGVAVYVWKIDAPEQLRVLEEAGVDGVIFAEPGWGA